MGAGAQGRTAGLCDGVVLRRSHAVTSGHGQGARGGHQRGRASESRCRRRGGFSTSTSCASLVAVGTALTSGPPHRSVRERLPHTALTSGLYDGQPFVRTRLVVRATTPVTRISGSGSGTSALVLRSPWSPSFPLRTPRPTLPRRLCSPASLVLRGRPTPQRRPSQPSGLYPFSTVPTF